MVAGSAGIDDAALANADAEDANWLAYCRT
jgi:hypothetical protein